MNNFSDIRDEFIQNKAGFEVSEDNIYDLMEELVKNRELRTETGLRAKSVVLKNQGSLQKTLDLLKSLLAYYG